MPIKLIIPEEHFQKIVNMYEGWTPVTEIAKQYGVSIKAIYNVLKKCNIGLRKCTDRQFRSQYATNKKYSFDESYFEQINTPEKAYWLGFLFADGCVNIKHGKTGNTKGGTVQIHLKREDGYHLRNFVRELKGNIVVEETTAKCQGKIFETARLSINSIKMCNDLILLGCIPKKSLILEPPIGVPTEFNHAFIKGYFDGDGCFGYYPHLKNSKMYLSIMGTESLLNWIKDDLIKQNINSITISKSKSKAYELRINGRQNMCKFYNHIYNKSTWVLGRKRDLFTQALLELDLPLDMSPVGILAQNI
jgi:predicted DNA-binding protein YlxM (UPF0122 family)